MACNLPRWDWLIQGTYNGLPPIQRGVVMSQFFKRSYNTRSYNTRDDIALYDIMTELGIQIKGTDPHPPEPPPQVTQAGADEYDQIMLDLESVGL